jgi:hypothetical protein
MNTKEVEQLAEETLKKHIGNDTMPVKKINILAALVEMYNAGSREADNVSFVSFATNDEPKMNYWGASEKDIEQFTKDHEIWKQKESIAWCKGYEKAALKFKPSLTQLQERIKELEARFNSNNSVENEKNGLR